MISIRLITFITVMSSMPSSGKASGVCLIPPPQYLPLPVFPALGVAGIGIDYGEPLIHNSICCHNRSG